MLLFLIKKKDSDKEWDVEASITIDEEMLAVTVTIPYRINYRSNQIIEGAQIT